MKKEWHLPSDLQLELVTAAKKIIRTTEAYRAQVSAKSRMKLAREAATELRLLQNQVRNVF